MNVASGTDLATDFVRSFFDDTAVQTTYTAYFIRRNIRPRLIDYFVTRHCRDNNVTILRDNAFVNVYFSYKQQLKSFHKKLFNLFSNTNRITIAFADGTEHTHSVCYWNFVRWLIAEGIIQYMVTIYREMEIQYAARRRLCDRKKNAKDEDALDDTDMEDVSSPSTTPSTTPSTSCSPVKKKAKTKKIIRSLRIFMRDAPHVSA